MFFDKGVLAGAIGLDVIGVRRGEGAAVRSNSSGHAGS